MTRASYRQPAFIALLTSSLVLTATAVSIASVGDTTIALWKDNLGGALSMTIDDALDDRAETMSILDEYGVKGTFFLNTVDLEARPALKTAMIAGSLNGHEIGSHTLTHPNLTSLSLANLTAQLRDSKIYLETNITGGKPVISLAYPFGDDNATVRAEAAKYYLSGRDVFPDALHPPTGQDFFMLGEDPGPINWTDATFIQETLNFATSAANTGGWAIEMYHNLANPGQTNQELRVTRAALRGHLEDLSSGDLSLWVAPVGDVVRYYRSREGAVLSTDFPGGNEMTVELTLNDPNGIIAAPLTLLTTVPGGWASGLIEVRQDGDLLPFTQTLVGSDLQLQYAALPNGGDVVLLAEALLFGDYNNDGAVDAADYVVWRKTNVNGQQGYITWRTHFGQSAGVGAASRAASAGVPEPANLLSLLIGALAVLISHGGRLACRCRCRPDFGSAERTIPEPSTLALVLLTLLGLRRIWR